MRPMTIVVVREEPAGGSGAGASALAGAADAVVTGAADAVVAGAGAPVAGAAAAVAGAADVAGAGAAGLAVVWAKPADAARRTIARTAVSVGRRFIAGKTIGRAPGRQAAGSAS